MRPVGTKASSLEHGRRGTLAALITLACVATALPARAEISDMEPESATVIQGGAAFTSLTLASPLGLTCLTAPDPPPGVAVIGVPGCLLGGNLMTIATTVTTPPGEYDIVFEERSILDGGVEDSAVFHLTVLPLIATTTSTTSTTTTSTTTTTTLPSTGSTTSTTTSIPGPTSTTTSTTSSTTTTAPNALDEPPGTVPSPTTSSSFPPESTDTTSERDDEAVAVGNVGDDDGSGAGLPPPGQIELQDRLEAAGLSFSLPRALTDVILSPVHLLAALVGAVLDTGSRVLVLVAVLVVYSAYLVHRWMMQERLEQAE